MCFLLVIIPLRCATLFSNFDAHGAYSNFEYVTGVSPPTVGSYITVAAPFTVAQSALLTSIDLPLVSINGASDVDVAILADDSGVPGASLESFSLVLGQAGGVSTLTSATHPLLTAGNQYWLSVGPAATSASVGWNFANGLSSTVAERPINGQWLTRTYFPGAFSVSGEPAPEPFSLLLIACGLLFLVVAERSALTR